MKGHKDLIKPLACSKDICLVLGEIHPMVQDQFLGIILRWSCKWDQGHQNQTKALSCLTDIHVPWKVWKNILSTGSSNNIILRMNQHRMLKIESKPPKPNQPLPMIIKCHIFASLVTIHSYLQEIWCKQVIFQHSCPPDLEYRVKVNKIYSVFLYLQIIHMSMFGLDQSIPSGRMMTTRHISKLFDVRWPWKWGQGHQNLISSFWTPYHLSL